MSVFEQTLTPQQQVAIDIDASVARAADELYAGYVRGRQLVFDNPNFKDLDGTPRPDLVYEAWAMNTTLRSNGQPLTVDQLQFQAVVTKTIINLFQPGFISDPVPEGIFVPPWHPQYAAILALLQG